MAEFCFQPGLTHQDIADALRPLSPSLASNTPVVAMGGRHAAQADQVIFASVDLLHYFGATNLDELSKRLFKVDGSLAQNFADLAMNLPLNGTPRIQRICVDLGQATRTIILLCRRTGDEGAFPLFVAAAVGVFDQKAGHRNRIRFDWWANIAGPLTGRGREGMPRLVKGFLLVFLALVVRGLSLASRVLDGIARLLRGVAQQKITDLSSAENSMALGAQPADMEPGLETVTSVAESDRTGLEAELRRQKSEARELSAILDTATDGVAVLDSQGRILSLNRSGEALFGYDQNDVVGEPFTILIAPESRGAAKDYLEGLKSNSVVSLLNQGREVIGLARQGGTIPIFMTLGRIGTGADQRKDIRFCALLRDLTHWKKVEGDLEGARKEAERASALKSEFLARVSHEIRTPLNAILGFAEVMMEERFGPIGNERYKTYLRDIYGSGALVMSLVNDLLDLSKIEAGKLDLDFASIDANRIVSECVSMMQPQASSERVVIKLSLSPALPHILANERSLRQIVLNLLSNAVKFNRPGGHVIVATALADAGNAIIRIRDTGIGMTEAEIDVAFEPFRQLATSRSSSGTGLGLSLTKALVEANHAIFSIKSKKNEGTVVEVAFPPARVLAE